MAGLFASDTIWRVPSTGEYPLDIIQPNIQPIVSQLLRPVERSR